MEYMPNNNEVYITNMCLPVLCPNQVASSRYIHRVGRTARAGKAGDAVGEPSAVAKVDGIEWRFSITCNPIISH